MPRIVIITCDLLQEVRVGVADVTRHYLYQHC
jgi:hypothetical protein